MLLTTMICCQLQGCPISLGFRRTTSTKNFFPPPLSLCSVILDVRTKTNNTPLKIKVYVNQPWGTSAAEIHALCVVIMERFNKQFKYLSILNVHASLLFLYSH